MADGTSIEWTDATWQIVTGCSVVSPGCTNCYAMRLAGTRLRNHASREGLTKATKAGPVWNGEVRFNRIWLTQPLMMTRPRMIFVAAHGDLFHKGVLDDWLDEIFAVMALSPQHVLQVLTKRPERMRTYLTDPMVRARIVERMAAIAASLGPVWTIKAAHIARTIAADGWPLPHVWLGVSAEDQRRADERVPILLDTPAAVRWISAEPLLGPIDFKRWCPTKRWATLAATGERVLVPDFYMTRCEHCGWMGSSELLHVAHGWDDADIICPACNQSIRGDDFGGPIGWIVAGGESGPGARPMHPDWARSIRDQCAEAGVPFLFKQHGAWAPAEEPASETQEDEELRGVGAWIDGQYLRRVGKKAAGRHLDGVLHDGFPTRSAP